MQILIGTMTKERENAMMVAAKILAGPFDKIANEDLNMILEHGNLAGAFIC